jgi:hypothetical protein
MGGQGLVPSAAGGLASALGAAPVMAIAGAATITAALALKGPLTGRTRARRDCVLDKVRVTQKPAVVSARSLHRPLAQAGRPALAAGFA